MEKQLYILSLSDAQEDPQVIPFWWDETGNWVDVVRQVIQERGHLVLEPGEWGTILIGDSKEMIELLNITIQAVDWNSLLQVGEPSAPLSIPFRLKENNLENKQQCEVAGQFAVLSNDVGIRFTGYETFDLDTPVAELAAIEIWNEVLRILTWSDKTNEEPVVVSLDGARYTGDGEPPNEQSAPHVRVERILTPEDRLAHMQWCKEKDAASPWGMVTNLEHYERLGDLAAINCNTEHDPESGFQRFKPDCPGWIRELATARYGWSHLLKV
jgi:hypothetical protein